MHSRRQKERKKKKIEKQLETSRSARNVMVVIVSLFYFVANKQKVILALQSHASCVVPSMFQCVICKKKTLRFLFHFQ